MKKTVTKSKYDSFGVRNRAADMFDIESVEVMDDDYLYVGMSLGEFCRIMCVPKTKVTTRFKNTLGSTALNRAWNESELWRGRIVNYVAHYPKKEHKTLLDIAQA